MHEISDLEKSTEKKFIFFIIIYLSLEHELQKILSILKPRRGDPHAKETTRLILEASSEVNVIFDYVTEWYTAPVARLSSVCVTYLVSSERRAHYNDGSGGRHDFIRWKRNLTWWTHRSLNRNKEKNSDASIVIMTTQKLRTNVWLRSSLTIS